MNLKSPKALFLFLALFVTLLALLLLGFLSINNPGTLPGIKWIFVTSVIFFFGVYGIAYFLLGKYFTKNTKKLLHYLHNNTNHRTAIKNATLNEDVFQKLKEAIKLWSEHKDRKIEKLKESENYRREFVGNVSHELKTPIFNIQGYIHTLLDGGLEDEVINHKYLKKAVKNIDRLSAIVEDLEAISQLETGELKLSLERFDLTRLASDVIETMDIGAKEKNINLRLEKNVDSSIYAKGDIGRIRQVLTNLVTNSIKYGRENGETVIRLKSEDQGVRVEVADNGIGIAKDHLPRLFERFFRVDKSRSRDQGGTGLGLSIVKHILEAHGKSIDVDSEPGKGTIFYFTLDKP